MAVRNLKIEEVDTFQGLNTVNRQQTTPPSEWIDSSNVLVSEAGTLLAMRSPANFNTALATGNNVLSAFYYNRAAGDQVLFDIQTGGASSTTTYQTTGAGNTALITGQANTVKTRVVVNNTAYQVDGTSAQQIVSGGSTYLQGITAPAAAPVVSIQPGGTFTISVGRTVSYAYRNSTTGHVGIMSAASNNSGPTNGGKTLRTPVVASTQAGVDGIVLFLSADGGSLRYLQVDASGNAVVYANTTGNIDISSPPTIDTNTQESKFNSRPPDTAQFIFKWRDRNCMCWFTGASMRAQLVYSGYEAISIGIPYESYPALNVITIPSKGETLYGGIASDIGALLLTDQNAYLLSGYPSDKVASPVNTLAPTEHLQMMPWNIGTRSPYTIQNTPFGIMWLDEAKHIQLWSYRGFPQEVGNPLRNVLKNIQDTESARNMAIARWFHLGPVAYYVLSASTTGSTNNKLFLIGMYQNSENHQLQFSYAQSDIAAQTIEPILDPNGVWRLLIGVTDRLREILNPTLAGAGWGASQTLYATLMTGNKQGNYSHLHSMKFDSLTSDVKVQISNQDGSEAESIALDKADGSGTYSGIINKYGVRHQMKILFPTDDSTAREVMNLRIHYSGKGRTI